MSESHITSAVPNICFVTRLPLTAAHTAGRRGELPFWSLLSVSSSAWKMVLTSAVVKLDCFYYYSKRNNVIVLFGTLKVQSFILTEVSDCGLLIVVYIIFFFPFSFFVFFIFVCACVCVSLYVYACVFGNSMCVGQ